MTIKCESCKHRVSLGGNLMEFCENPKVVPAGHPWARQGLWPLMNDGTIKESAREICNKEGDGIFVHFEPKIPGNGAAFGESRREFELDRLGQTGQDNAAAFKAAA